MRRTSTAPNRIKLKSKQEREANRLQQNTIGKVERTETVPIKLTRKEVESIWTSKRQEKKKRKEMTARALFVRIAYNANTWQRMEDVKMQIERQVTTMSKKRNEQKKTK